MVDLSKLPNDKTHESIAKFWNMQYNYKIMSYLAAIFLLPLGVGIVSK